MLLSGVFPGDKGINNGLMPTTYGYFEHVLVWLAGASDTVVRAGFGMFTRRLKMLSTTMCGIPLPLHFVFLEW